jgi:hypothetical protein
MKLAKNILLIILLFSFLGEIINDIGCCKSEIEQIELELADDNNETEEEKEDKKEEKPKSLNNTNSNVAMDTNTKETDLSHQLWPFQYFNQKVEKDPLYSPPDRSLS